MFAKENGSTVGETPLCYWRIYCRFFLNKFAKENELTVAQTP